MRSKSFGELRTATLYSNLQQVSRTLTLALAPALTLTLTLTLALTRTRTRTLTRRWAHTPVLTTPRSPRAAWRIS